jgi:ABC-type polysaccharide/polyol phosphate export permease
MFLLSILYFITPIFYTKDLVPAHLHWVIDYSPVYILLAPFQTFALGFSLAAWLLLFLKSATLSLCLLLLSFLHWKKIKNSFYLNL